MSESRTWTLNGIDRTEATNDGHLSKFSDGYVFELLGKDAEVLADQQIVFQFKHRDFQNPQTVTLKTDEKGRVALGALAGIESVEVSAPNGRSKNGR